MHNAFEVVKLNDLNQLRGRDAERVRPPVQACAQQNRPAFAGDSDVDACPRRRNETAFNNGMAIGHQRSSSEVLARQLNDAKTFRLLTLPFDLPPVQIMVHTIRASQAIWASTGHDVREESLTY